MSSLKMGSLSGINQRKEKEEIIVMYELYPRKKNEFAFRYMELICIIFLPQRNICKHIILCTEKRQIPAEKIFHEAEELKEKGGMILELSKCAE